MMITPVVRKLRNKEAERKGLQSLDEFVREQGYLAFDQVDGFLPQDVSSPADRRFALESF
jgi:hypothetical protein